MPDPVKVVKCSMEVYVYTNESGAVERVIMWDDTLTPISEHVYDGGDADDAGEIITEDAKLPDGYWPEWEFFG